MRRISGVMCAGLGFTQCCFNYSCGCAQTRRALFTTTAGHGTFTYANLSSRTSGSSAAQSDPTVFYYQQTQRILLKNITNMRQSLKNKNRTWKMSLSFNHSCTVRNRILLQIKDLKQSQMCKCGVKGSA